MSMPRILVVGSVNMDLVLEIDRVPAPGENLIGTRYSYLPGGKGGVANIWRGTEPVAEQSYLTEAFGREAVKFISKQRPGFKSKEFQRRKKIITSTRPGTGSIRDAMCGECE